VAKFAGDSAFAFVFAFAFAFDVALPYGLLPLAYLCSLSPVPCLLFSLCLRDSVSPWWILPLVLILMLFCPGPRAKGQWLAFQLPNYPITKLLNYAIL